MGFGERGEAIALQYPSIPCCSAATTPNRPETARRRPGRGRRPDRNVPHASLTRGGGAGCRVAEGGGYGVGRKRRVSAVAWFVELGASRFRAAQASCFQRIIVSRGGFRAVFITTSSVPFAKCSRHRRARNGMIDEGKMI